MDDFWEKNAQNWSDVVSNNLIKSRVVTNAAILNAIASAHPTSVLDIGCGQGWISLELKSTTYLGIDGSANLIRLAKKNDPASSFEQVTYEQLSKKAWTLEAQFDVIVFNFSLLDKDIIALLQHVAGFLAPSGRLLIQTLHPMNLLPNYEDRWNEEHFKATQINFDGTMPWYGRTLSTWVQLFKDCDLNISKVTEPKTDGAPLSIIFELTK